MDAIRRTLGWLLLLYALVFLLFGLLHAGIAIGPLSEPVIVPAAIVEPLCAVAALAGSYGALRDRTWAWDGLVYSHAAALGGVLLGILALAFGDDSDATALLTWYHNAMAVALTAGLSGAFYVSRVRE
ncbi:hypothetical protein AB0I81_37445 [Nonomuraea sp. NPDC050404]|uniref:hypothetical protein n=1 Tax=Nonomuraea sp. NPDC050404 TaxID=3155783 RepID=UPI00340F9708